MSSSPIYLDYHATTPCDPAVIEFMLPYFGVDYGNASSRQHIFGWKAAEAVKLSREKVATFIQSSPDEIIFTSGSTESINLAIKGVAGVYAAKGRHIITAATEHAAVRDTCKRLESEGYSITYLEPDGSGMISPGKLESAIRHDTILIALMWANNETGLIYPVQQYSEIARKYQVLFFTDATQAVGKIPVSVKNSGIALMSFSAHKLYGPKGVGALYVSRKDPRVKLLPLMDGGGQEKGIRSGTLNVPGIAGFGEAIRICNQNMSTESILSAKLRNMLESELLMEEEVYVNGNRKNRLPGITNLSFRFTDGQVLLAALNRDLAVSSGSACSSASGEPSPVLMAMGLGKAAANSSVRFSLGRFTTENEVREAINLVKTTLKAVREGGFPAFSTQQKEWGADPLWLHPDIEKQHLLK